MSDAFTSVVLALGDDELVLGHRHSEWTGFAPHVEEDVAFSSIAQDEIGHAAAYYSLVAATTGDDPDRIALGRAKSAYRNAVLCERKNQDWAYTLARHWVYDTADAIRLEALEASPHDKLAALARKIRREERYHLIHARAWMSRVSQGPVEGRTKLIDALDDAFAEAAGLFEPFEGEEQALTEGFLTVSSDDLKDRFYDEARSALDELALPPDIPARRSESAEFVASSAGDLIAGTDHGQPERATTGSGGRRGHHTADFDQLWEDLTYTYSRDPGATW